MSISTTIATAGNALPSALASLRTLGYSVTQSENSALCRAENGVVSFVAEDVLLLLGLVKLYEMRGSSWQPTDQEVEAYLAFDTQKDDNQVDG